MLLVLLCCFHVVPVSVVSDNNVLRVMFSWWINDWLRDWLIGIYIVPKLKLRYWLISIDTAAALTTQYSEGYVNCPLSICRNSPGSYCRGVSYVFSSSWAGVMAGGLAAAVTPLDCWRVCSLCPSTGKVISLCQQARQMFLTNSLCLREAPSR